jgi:hypothetical protein
VALNALRGILALVLWLMSRGRRLVRRNAYAFLGTASGAAVLLSGGFLYGMYLPPLPGTAVVILLAYLYGRSVEKSPDRSSLTKS